jgi:hypothetical protein
MSTPDLTEFKDRLEQLFIYAGDFQGDDAYIQARSFVARGFIDIAYDLIVFVIESEVEEGP